MISDFEFRISDLPPTHPNRGSDLLSENSKFKIQNSECRPSTPDVAKFAEGSAGNSKFKIQNSKFETNPQDSAR